MKRDHRKLILAIALAVAVVLAWLYWHRKAPRETTQSNQSAADANPSADPSAAKKARSAIPPSAEEEKKRENEARWSLLFMTPISVYGKVLDEKGSPIAGASVEIGVNDNLNPTESGSKYVKTTDKDGLFSLTGAHGIGFSLRAYKNGYYPTEHSHGGRNVTVHNKDDLPQPSKEQPIVLILRKQGETVPLIFVSSRQIDVPRTGQPIHIDLASGRTGQASLQVTSWLGESNQRKFDWRYQLSIPGGGLMPRSGPFEFEAPTDGFQETLETDMRATVTRWSSDVSKDYFAKLPDGRYARFSINFYPSKERNFIVIQSYVNPQPGSRNLEYDLAKQIIPR